MKKAVPFILCLCAMAAFPAFAEEKGFYGRVGVEAAWVSTNDRLDPYADVKDPITAGASPANDSRVDVIPVIDLGWQVDSLDSSIYLATPFRAPGFPLALGIFHEVSDGTGVDLSLYTVLDKREYRDPYLAADLKKQSKVKNMGIRLDLSQIASSGFGAALLWQTESVEEDDLADRYPVLDRTGSIIEASGRYTFELGEEFLIGPVAAYERGDYDGKANSYRGGSAGLFCSTEGEKFAMNSTLTYGIKEYSDTNPEFSKKLSEELIGFNALLTWKKPLGVKNLFLNAHGAFDVRNANISYHDAETYLIGLGASLGF